jgi:hypothetical protein
MKPIKNVLILSLIAGCIIVFWLIPGINTAKETRYVRYYENVDVKSAAVDTENRKIKKTTVDTIPGKVYKKEVIEPRKSKRIDPEMFSRAMQYEPLAEDSIMIYEVVEVSDSLAVIL